MSDMPKRQYVEPCSLHGRGDSGPGAASSRVRLSARPAVHVCSPVPKLAGMDAPPRIFVPRASQLGRRSLRASATAFSACPRRPAPRPRVYRALLMPRTRSGAAEATVAPEGGRADADHANTRDHRQDAKFESRPLRQEVQATAQQWLFSRRTPQHAGFRRGMQPLRPSPRRMDLTFVPTFSGGPMVDRTVGWSRSVRRARRGQP